MASRPNDEGHRARKGVLLYRAAAVMLGVLCVGHTLGGVIFHRSSGPAEDGVLRTMQEVHFPFMGTDCTYMGIQRGYGFMTAIFIALSAFLAWQLGERAAPRAHPLAWALSLSLGGVAFLSGKYFFPGPAMLSGGAAVLLGAAALRR